MDLSYTWRGAFSNPELSQLHAEGFGNPTRDYDWVGQVTNHSLGWVTCRADELVGFVNVAWDGGVHAFILDTVVAISHRGNGIGSRLVEVAVLNAAEAGSEWLHVDFEDHLSPFYLAACAFSATQAGLIRL